MMSLVVTDKYVHDGVKLTKYGVDEAIIFRHFIPARQQICDAAFDVCITTWVVLFP